MKIVTPKNIPKFIIILPIIGILLTTIFISLITIYTIQNNFEKEKIKITKQFFDKLQKTTKQRVNLTYNIIDALYKHTKDYNKTIHLMQKVLAKMKWEQKGYIFVFDYYGNTLYHPNHYYMTINRWNFERNGVKVIRLLIESALKHPEGTYVKYLAYNPDGSPKEKVSFVKVYKPLKIVIGNGVYLNYLDKKLIKQQNSINLLLKDILMKLIFTSLFILIFMLLIMYYFSNKLKQLFQNYEKKINDEKYNLFIQANFDNLTNLHNRNHFLLELKEHIELLKRNQKKLAVLFIDLDHFKEINDSLGHHIGDEVLKVSAQRLKECVRKTDIVSRFGGDEFVILTYDISTHEVTDLAEKILNNLKKPIEINKIKYYISASIGISTSDDTLDENMLIKNADIAMYKAKKAGKDRLSFYKNKMSEDATQRIKLKNQLHTAFEKNQFEIYFQPQIDKNENLYGAEVLIRWNLNGKIISPFHFVPLAIEIGLIDKIDLWVIETAIKQYNSWLKQGYQIGVISCNVTIYQLEKNDFASELKRLLKKYNFDAKNLNLEVTEESVMKNPEKSISTLYKIQQLGIKINIDDFGTGYSSMSYLKKLPISKLKIDRSFIKDIPDNKDDMIITKTIINLGQNLNLKIVAEGVETDIQKKFIFENGADIIQGYYYSPPIPAEQFEKKFLKNRKDKDVSNKI